MKDFDKSLEIILYWENIKKAEHGETSFRTLNYTELVA